MGRGREGNGEEIGRRRKRREKEGIGRREGLRIWKDG